MIVKTYKNGNIHVTRDSHEYAFIAEQEYPDYAGFVEELCNDISINWVGTIDAESCAGVRLDLLGNPNAKPGTYYVNGTDLSNYEAGKRVILTPSPLNYEGPFTVRVRSYDSSAPWGEETELDGTIHLDSIPYATIDLYCVEIHHGSNDDTPDVYFEPTQHDLVQGLHTGRYVVDVADLANIDPVSNTDIETDCTDTWGNHLDCCITVHNWVAFVAEEA